MKREDVELYAHGVLDPEHRDTVFIQWNLIGDLNAPLNGNEQYCIFVKERLFAIAKNIFTLNRPLYCFTLTGSEPTLHPHLAALTEYLFSANVPLGVILEASEACDEAVLAEVLKNATKNSFLLRLRLSETCDELHVTSLLSQCAKAKQAACVVVDGDERSPIVSQLLTLRRSLPFTLETTSPVVQKAFAEAAAKGPEDLPTFSCGTPRCAHDASLNADFSLSDAEAIPLCANFYCCVGLNLFSIDPNGQFSAAANGLAPVSKVPLWDAGKRTFGNMVRIVKCHDTNLLVGANRVLPKFATKEDALAWIQDAAAREEQETQSSVISGVIPSAESMLTSRLRRLAPVRKDATPLAPADPAWIAENTASLTDIFTSLSDTESKSTFLRLVKTIETGDSRYLPLPKECAAPETREGEVVFDLATTKDIDAYLAKHDTICTELKGTCDDLALLEGAKETILDYAPRLRLTAHSSKQVIAIVQWIRATDPTYSISLRAGEGTSLRILANPAQEPARILPAITFPRPVFSVCVVVDGNNEEHVERCVSSIIAQERSDVEILLLCTDAYGADDEIDRLLRTYPKTIRCFKMEESTRADVLNTGLDMACGQYMTVVNSQSMLSWTCFDHAVSVIEKEHPDIICFDQVFSQGDTYEHLDLAEKTLVGRESLEAFLAEDLGTYDCTGTFYRLDRVRNLKISFAAVGSETDLAFTLHTHAKSRKTCVLPYVASFQEKPSDDEYEIAEDNTLKDFAAFVTWFVGFCKKLSLDPESAPCSHMLERVYTKKRTELLRSLDDFTTEDDEEQKLSDEILAQLSSSKDILSYFLKDYALCYCQAESLDTLMPPEEQGYEEEVPQQPLSAYNETEDGTSPTLSVLLSSTEEPSPQTLESILTQTYQDFECVVVSNDPDDEGYAVLQDFADVNPHIRLYRLPNASANACRNVLLQKAKGQYVLFVDMGDICKPDFFQKAIHCLEENEADMACMSVEGPNGVELYSYGEDLYGEDRIQSFLEDEGGNLFGTIFDRRILDRYNIRFSEKGSRPYFFCKEAFSNASCIATDAFVGYQRKERAKNPQATYEELQELYGLAESFRTTQENNHFPESAREWLERLWQNISAFWQSEHYLPMSDSDFTALRNPVFLRTLFKDLAERVSDDDGILTAQSFRELRPFDITKICEPYVSIFTPNCMPSDEELQELAKYPLLVTLFFQAYATQALEESGDFDEPTLDELSLASAPDPATYLIPYGSHTPKDPILSIIVVTKNNGETITRCLESLQNEKAQSVEIILVDDCSTDETVTRCREAKKKDTRIRFFSTPWATGIGQARNLALQASQGQWVLFVDPEDWVCKGFLSSCVQELKSAKGSDMLGCSWQLYSAEKEQVMAEKQASATDLRDWLLWKVEKNGLWSKVLRKEFLVSHAIDFLPHQKADEFLFLTRMYTADPKIKATRLKSVCHVVEKNEDVSRRIRRVDFEESITSILAMHRLLTKTGYATTSEEYKQILQSYAGNEICEHLLQYVYVLKKIGGTSADRISELKDVLGFLEKCVYSYKKRANDEDSDDSEDKD